MKSFAVSTSIQSTPGRIWALLTDAGGYPRWNTTIDRVEGEIALGRKLTIHAKINPGRAFPVKVTTFHAPSRMTWSGGMPFGLFSGERTFTLTSGPDGSIEFSMQECYAGPFASLITRSIPDLQPAFDQFALDLKRAAEAD